MYSNFVIHKFIKRIEINKELAIDTERMDHVLNVRSKIHKKLYFIYI